MKRNSKSIIKYAQLLLIIGVLATVLDKAVAQDDSFRGSFTLKGKKFSTRAQILAFEEKGVRWREAAGAKVNLTPYDQIILSSLEIDTPDAYLEAQTHFLKNEYKQAAVVFGALADKYGRKFDGLKNSFSNNARFFQFESLRKIGDLAGIAKDFTKFKPSKFSGERARRAKLFRLWSMAGEQKWEALLKRAKGELEKNPSALEQAQIGYLAGLACEEIAKSGNSKEVSWQNALQYYAYAYSLNYVDDAELAKMALSKSIEILSSQADIEKSPMAMDELKGLASIYKLVYGGQLSPQASKLISAGK